MADMMSLARVTRVGMLLLLQLLARQRALAGTLGRIVLAGEQTEDCSLFFLCESKKLSILSYKYVRDVAACAAYPESILR